MKRSFCTLLLAALLLCAAPSAGAAEMVLPAAQVYSAQFADVADDAWYYPYVKTLYELGLTNGKDQPDSFAPDDRLSVAEAITMAARLRSLYDNGSSEQGAAAFPSDGVWYAPYLSYLQSLEILGSEFDMSYDQPATRAQMAHILASTLPEDALAPINSQVVTVCYAKGTYIQDVSPYTPYQQDILSLYRWGILNGKDGAGSFLPEETILRSEMATMVARLADSRLRITLHWDTALFSSKAGTALKDLVDCDGSLFLSPAASDAEAIDADIRYMLSRGERQLSLSYPPNTLSQQGVNDLLQAFLAGIRFYVEQGYNSVLCSYSARTGSLTLTFSSSLGAAHLLDSYRNATIEAAILVHDQLWLEGQITGTMTEEEKARAYFTWLCQNCAYDFSSADDSVSHSGYGALVNALAVCDGYTAAYNLLLKLEGISCTTMSTTDHIWTVAMLDGVTCHIDPTWGDQTGEIDYQYFAMTEEASLARFP